MACHETPHGAQRIGPIGGRREATESSSGTEDGNVWMIPARMAGWIDVDAYLKFDGNAESQAQSLLVKGCKGKGIVNGSISIVCSTAFRMLEGAIVR